jgi:thiamine pyrophosphate-dependent acetolactate synthase large subunit-like protein
MTPDYLTIRKPNFNFTKLAAAFGITGGGIVKQPGEVRAALKQGFDHVLTKKQSFVLDIRVPHAEPQPGAKKTSASAAVESLQPPPLDLYYYREKGQAIEGLDLSIQTPVIF